MHEPRLLACILEAAAWRLAEGGAPEDQHLPGDQTGVALQLQPGQAAQASEERRPSRRQAAIVSSARLRV